MKRIGLACLLVFSIFPAFAVPLTYIADFSVTVDGALVFEDKFLDGNPPPSAFNSVTNASATYTNFSGWSSSALSESNGRLQMDPSTVGPGRLADGTVTYGGVLQLPVTLNQSSTFTVTGRFGLSSLPQGGVIGIQLTNNTATSGTAASINVNNGARGCPSGATVCGSLTDYGAGTIQSYATGTLDASLGDEILLKLDHPTAGSSTINASYQYWRNGSPAGGFISLGSTDRDFKTQNWVQARFFASLATIPVATSVTEFPVPTDNGRPFGITSGPDGALWFVEARGDKIGRITTGGTVTEYPLPSSCSPHPKCSLQTIVSGPDGALWFVEGDGNKIGRITTAGVITEYDNTPGGWPQSLTVGPDGNLWFADQGPMGGGAASGDGSIGRITPAGVITKFPLLTPNTQADFITAGPDGALWFTQSQSSNKIGRITVGGIITEFLIPSGAGFIITGPDGALWFTEPAVNKIGRITTAGVVTEFRVAAPSGPLGLTLGPDGAFWYTETGYWTPSGFTGSGHRIGRITTSGAVTEYAIPTSNSTPAGITLGPDGALWFSEGTGNNIAKLTLLPASSTNPADCLFNWAEKTYPTLFAPAGASSANALQYYYRHYSQTNAYLATSSADNHVYYFGPLSNNAILDVGALSTWLVTASCQ